MLYSHSGARTIFETYCLLRRPSARNSYASRQNSTCLLEKCMGLPRAEPGRAVSLTAQFCSWRHGDSRGAHGECRHDGHKMSRDQCGVGDGSGGSGFNASLHCRVQAYSVDGGRTFGNFTGKGRWLPDTPVKGGLARWPQRRALLFSNPDVQLEPCPLHCINDYGRCDATQGQGCFSQRNDVTIFASTYNGYSWPHKILVWPWNGHSYSDVVVLPDGRPAALISTSNSTRVVGVAGSVTLAIVNDPDTLLPPLSTTGSM